MARPSRWLPGLAFGALCATPWLPGASPQGDGTPAVGLLDLRRAINEDRAYVAAQAEIDAWRADKQESLDAAEGDVQRMEAELESLKPDSAEFRQRRKDLLLRNASVKIEFETLKEELDRRRTDALRAAYERALDACEKVRAAKGLDLVVQVNVLAVPTGGPDDLVRDMLQRPVLAYAGALDVTGDALAILNAQ